MKFLLQCDVDGLGLQIYILQKVIYKYNDARMYYILSFIRKYIFTILETTPSVTNIGYLICIWNMYVFIYTIIFNSNISLTLERRNLII